MAITCIVKGCTSRGVRDKVSFYRVPRIINSIHYPHLKNLSARRRELWIMATRKNDLTDSMLRNQRVCSKHFVTGKPASLCDVSNPDWVPTLNLNPKSHKEKLELTEMEIISGNDNLNGRENEKIQIEIKDCVSEEDLVKTIINRFNRKEIEIQFDSPHEITSEDEVESFQCIDCTEEFSQQRLLEAHSKQHKQPRSFPCKFCNKIFQRETLLRRHIGFHTLGEQYECSDCKKQFISEGNLFVHKQRKHAKDLPFSCCMCPKKFALKNELKSHEAIHSENKIVQCNICNEKFLAEPFLERHMREHEKQMRRFQCGACDELLSCQKDLDRHLKVHSLSKCGSEGEEDCQDTNQNQHECIVCGTSFSDARELQDHEEECMLSCSGEFPMRLETGEAVDTEMNASLEDFAEHNKNVLNRIEDINEAVTERDGRHFSADFDREEIEIQVDPPDGSSSSDSENLFQLDFIPGNENDLELHSVFHRKGRQIRCETCRKLFTKKSLLRNHLKNFPHGSCLECPKCKKRFTTRNNLFGHTRRVHLTNRPYKCQVCSKTFALIYTLKTHEETHTNNKSFLCGTCGKSFSLQSYLKKHLIVHEQKPKENLPRPYKCSLCEKSFRGQNTLNRHMLVHTKEKRYQCDVCFKRFARQHHVRTHMKVHIAG